MRERHNSYGTLITVLAFIIVVIYSGNNPDTTGNDYDWWDVMITLIAMLFGCSFLRRISDADTLEVFIASCLAGTSTATFLTASASLIPINALNDIARFVDTYLFFFSVAAALVFGVWRTMRQTPERF